MDSWLYQTFSGITNLFASVHKNWSMNLIRKHTLKQCLPPGRKKNSVYPTSEDDNHVGDEYFLDSGDKIRYVAAVTCRYFLEQQVLFG